jgi:glutamine synthetase
MFSTFDDARIYVQENAFQMIDLKFSDLWGRWHHVCIPAHEFNEQLMRDGVGFDGPTWQQVLVSLSRDQVGQ